MSRLGSSVKGRPPTNASKKYGAWLDFSDPASPDDPQPRDHGTRRDGARCDRAAKEAFRGKLGLGEKIEENCAP